MSYDAIGIPIQKDLTAHVVVVVEHTISPSPSQLQTPSTIAVCLPDSPDLVVLVKCRGISWFLQIRFCWRGRNLESRITITPILPRR